MKDCNGVELAVGDRVWWRPVRHREPFCAWVRHVSASGVRLDDGDWWDASGKGSTWSVAGTESKPARIEKHPHYRGARDPRIAELEAERDQLRGRLAQLETALAMDTPYPLLDVLTRLADAADHLHVDHNCDADGWETARDAAASARKILANLAVPEVPDAR